MDGSTVPSRCAVGAVAVTVEAVAAGPAAAAATAAPGFLLFHIFTPALLAEGECAGAGVFSTAARA